MSNNDNMKKIIVLFLPVIFFAVTAMSQTAGQVPIKQSDATPRLTPKTISIPIKPAGPVGATAQKLTAESMTGTTQATKTATTVPAKNTGALPSQTPVKVPQKQ